MTEAELIGTAIVVMGALILHSLGRLAKQLDELINQVSRMRTSTAGALWTTGTGTDKPTLERVIDELSGIAADVQEIARPSAPSSLM